MPDELQSDLSLNREGAAGYLSNSQRARVMTERWVADHLFCPVCGASRLRQYEANRPVADFYCPSCAAEFELKSQKNVHGLPRKVMGGAYEAMIQRINCAQNPNFFFLTRDDFKVNNLVFIPRHFFVDAIIEKRKPLSNTARRAGWTGCAIDLEALPLFAKISIIRDGRLRDPLEVIKDYQHCCEVVKPHMDLASRGWLLEVLRCVESLPGREFSLPQMYKFESALRRSHPDNNFVKEKIRQQLQVLRDLGLLEFVSRGKYKKTKQIE